jgi:3-deoxy-D-manno-octulosonic-acid transferase
MPLTRLAGGSDIAAMPSTSMAYRALVRAGTWLAPAAGVFQKRLGDNLRARRGAGEGLLRWARSGGRDPRRPLVWFHAASVGEGRQAEAVLMRLRELRPDCQLVYTHFSLSAASLANQLPVDAADYLPYDLPKVMDRLLLALQPQLLVFVKLDLWPELSTRAAAKGVTVVMVAGTVSPASGRLRWPARPLLAPGYQVIAAAGAISEDDAERLARLGVPTTHICVLGDPRFDSVRERVAAVPAGDPLLLFGKGVPTIVAGSTWPADESILLRAFSRLHADHPAVRLILVPHEPTEAHLRSVEKAAAHSGLPVVRLSTATEAAPLLLVDRTGILASLYGAGTMAYVGGGFGRAGLHSVLEPAAWGIPLVFGPRWSNSREAGLLLRASGAVQLPSSPDRAVEFVYRQWKSWVADESSRMLQGRNARKVVDSGLGASQRTAEMLAGLISSPLPRMSPPVERSIHPSAG